MFVPPVYAQCPVCVVTVGGGLLIAKKLGIDDLLVSIWLSGLNTALAFWFASSMKHKLLKSGLGWAIGFFILTIGYLVYSKQLGHQGNTFLGIDKIVVGMTVGFIISLFAIFVDKLIRKKNNGKVLFYYQKVIIPIITFIITTGIFALLIKIYSR
ncbi:hypothetical protein A2334_04705 [Candidatus Roizmanbacteria bacterium RIFOXYB2_FULL_38_10]|uniref:Uncharacterized protein n=1 Tax=Candidatus Roizmanbacteria bacterium RIFOXYD1_FULL_38_12 TaxID=1802093 RepID=A0A1F7KZL6_9BACT|nr:MAG: hypothetical protein A3K47_00805 [Candidatus Roizmanbacteria bacterium RIFOXYA2_FULL_38_14]OGK63326.1 MAG: hypothetical protein A3K27_00805 [Candidatus Roizmanbacteria bacterium RIFOXYA1_FULL_37_12]OGK65172.1 MAG: hypothetical protein A3K38_00805 [Candidatus Roizmanbacteria bacterium RIFOXYB1_FULL_40_23]OGK68728.1 MAG: hypothetical protein A2334_04705 [Candidatus Roizmanbacteria bacterium RIFOXYB2_FULL_38_10]OGK69577.1 MAG: hypothetical protein A3K21_00810 [Candidatus Roizmanbacteria ba